MDLPRPFPLVRSPNSPVPDGVSSVGQLSSDAIIQAVGSMIAGMDGSRPPPEALSTRGCHPAERFHACRLVASRVRVSVRRAVGPRGCGSCCLFGSLVWLVLCRLLVGASPEDLFSVQEAKQNPTAIE